MKLKRIGCFLLAALYWASLSSAAFGLSLTESERRELESGLTSMLSEARTLKALLTEQSESLKKWKESCEELESKLQAALQDLESSRMTVVELRKLTAELKKRLEELKAEYLSLCKSLAREKTKRRIMTGVAIAALAAAAAEGIVLALKK